MSEDNWKHRSAKMRCQTCMWFVPKVSGSGETKIGRCRERSPTVKGWPAVFPNDWCGSHKLDEDKIDQVASVERPKFKHLGSIAPASDEKIAEGVPW